MTATFSGVLHPVGPHSPKVYWARRIGILVVLLLVLAAGVFYMARRAGGSSTPSPAAVEQSQSSNPQLTGVLAPTTTTTNSDVDALAAQQSSQAAVASASSQAAAAARARAAASSSAAAASAAAASSAEASSRSAAASSSAASKAAADKAAADKAAADKAAAAKAAAEKAAADKAAAAKAAAEKARQPTKDAAGNLICGDGAMKLQATTGSSSFPAGSQPLLGVSVTYTGDVACQRDLSGALQVFTVYGINGDRVWSTADCFPGSGSDVRTLNPGDTVQYNIRWSGTTSNPGCTQDRVRVPAGDYTLQVTIGTLKATPAWFKIV